MLQTRVHGRDRVEFMESICTADVAGLADGAAALTVFTNDQGGIVDDLIVTKVREGNHLYVVSNAGCRDKDIPLMVRKAEEMKRYNLNIYKTLTFLRSRAIGSKSMRHIKMVDGSMDSPQYGGHRRHILMLIE